MSSLGAWNLSIQKLSCIWPSSGIFSKAFYKLTHSKQHWTWKGSVSTKAMDTSNVTAFTLIVVCQHNDLRCWSPWFLSATECAWKFHFKLQSGWNDLTCSENRWWLQCFLYIVSTINYSTQPIGYVSFRQAKSKWIS